MMKNGDMAYSGRLILQGKTFCKEKHFARKKFCKEKILDKKSHCTDAREQPTQWLMCE
jgi:hypothetical protein